MYRNFISGLGTVALSIAFLTGGNMLAGQDRDANADNTRVNKDDRDNSRPTADQGKNDRSDRDLEKNIRREVVRDKALSTYGHNVKVVAQHGTVTLRGPVHSEEEKRAIEEHARKYAGEGHINNELTVKGDRT